MKSSALIPEELIIQKELKSPTKANFGILLSHILIQNEERSSKYSYIKFKTNSFNRAD